LLALPPFPLHSNFSYNDGRPNGPTPGANHSGRGGGVQRLPRAFILCNPACTAEVNAAVPQAAPEPKHFVRRERGNHARNPGQGRLEAVNDLIAVEAKPPGHP
jgi:hypothetical protein